MRMDVIKARMIRTMRGMRNRKNYIISVDKRRLIEYIINMKTKTKKLERDNERRLMERMAKEEKEVQAMIDSVMANGGDFNEWLRQTNEADAVNRC
jgi:hypothetical protein